jgi:hypothetical protein
MKTLILLFIVVILQSCSIDPLPQKEYNSERSRVYKKTSKEILDKINNWICEKNSNIKIIEKEQNLIHVEIRIADSLGYKYSDFRPTNTCFEFHNLMGDIDILINPNDIYTKLEILASFFDKYEAKQVSFKGQYSENKLIKYKSTGILEKEILDFVNN